MRNALLTTLVFGAIFFPLAAAAGSGPTTGEVKSYPPGWRSTAGVELALISGGFEGGDGVGVGGHYDVVLQPKMGPGHFTLGAEGLFGSTQSDSGPGLCRGSETIVHMGMRARYFFDIHPVIRPWAGIGVGAYSFNREYRDCALAADDDLVLGIPLALGLDFTFDAITASVSFNYHQSAPEDFEHVGFGLGWRF
ncbi:MAG TPA: outer membrane beta-barrel protein [bacterium]|nr:outer membrane beta-barrel protein [bacterium]